MDSWLVRTMSQSDEGTGGHLSDRDERAGAILEFIVARMLTADSPANTRIFDISGVQSPIRLGLHFRFDETVGIVEGVLN